MTATAAPSVIHVPTLADELLAEARRASAGRAARTLTPGAERPLNQTLVALEEGVSLSEHNCPPAATLHVLIGPVCLTAGDDHVDLAAGDHTPIPPVRHSLSCIDDAVVVLTAATTASSPAQPPRQPALSTTDDDTAVVSQLDVRSEPPARRHELIFATYHALESGEAFTLVNDHDPKPLYYQFAADHPGEFAWDYLDTGPQTWRVRIAKK